MTNPNLDLETDRAFQVGFWRFQRIAWVGFALVILIALAGLTGKGGPLAVATVNGPQGKIDYPRVTRWQASEEITISLRPSVQDQATVEIDADFFDIFQVEHVRPTPSESYATGSGQRLVFDLAQPPGSSTISLFVRPMQPTLSSSLAVRIEDSAPLVLTPVVLP